MSVQLNHTIVHAHDKHEPPGTWSRSSACRSRRRMARSWSSRSTTTSPSTVADDHGEPHSQHYAFLVSEDEFDAIHGADPGTRPGVLGRPVPSQPGEINHADGGRGLYWNDPNGHSLEIITVPYGGWR